MIWGIADRIRLLLDGKLVTSDAGVAFIANEEGFVDHVYKDFAGVPTIGYGHALQPGETFPDRITEAEGRRLLARDLAATERAVRDAVTAPLNQDQFDALVSLVFNIGPGHWKESTVLRCLNSGDYAGAAEAFEMWNKAHDPKTGALAVSPTLRGRRRRERAVFER